MNGEFDKSYTLELYNKVPPNFVKLIGDSKHALTVIKVEFE